MKKIQSLTTPNYKVSIVTFLIEYVMLASNKQLPPFYWRKGVSRNEIRFTHSCLTQCFKMLCKKHSTALLYKVIMSFPHTRLVKMYQCGMYKKKSTIISCLQKYCMDVERIEKLDSLPKDIGDPAVAKTDFSKDFRKNNRTKKSLTFREAVYGCKKTKNQDS